MRSFLDEYPLNSGRLAAAPIFADHVENVVLGAAELLRMAVPAGARFALFSFDGDIRVKPGTSTTTLAAPDATTANGSGAELNPGVRRIPTHLSDGSTPLTHLCLWAPSATAGSVSFYA